MHEFIFIIIIIIIIQSYKHFKTQERRTFEQDLEHREVVALAFLKSYYY